MPPGSSSRRPQGRASGGRSRSPRPAARRPADGRRGSGSPQRRRLTSRAILLLAVTGLLMASYASSLHAWWQQRAEIQAKEDQIALLEGELEDIEDEFSRWRDDAFLEQQARERFGWVMPGEVGYRVIGLDGEELGVVGDLTDTEDIISPEWYDAVWGSIEEAGRDVEEAPEPEDFGPDPDVILDLESDS